MNDLLRHEPLIFFEKIRYNILMCTFVFSRAFTHKKNHVRFSEAVESELYEEKLVLNKNSIKLNLKSSKLS